MKGYLIVGGPHDGEYLYVKAHVMVLPYTRHGIFSMLMNFVTSKRTECHEYWLTTLHRSPDGIETAVYRHNSLSFQEAVQRLISRYTA